MLSLCKHGERFYYSIGTQTTVCIKQQMEKEKVNNMKVEQEATKIMTELSQLGREQIKQIYLRHGAREPLFGVTTQDLKPLAKRYKAQYELALVLYQSGNYDAMYLAGMISDPSKMREQDFEEWITHAYCQGLSDHVVAVTLAGSPFAQNIADRWIHTQIERYVSAGWTCYAWMLGTLSDENFDKEKLQTYLWHVQDTIHHQGDWVTYAMNSFLIAVGVSYLPLHHEAMAIANEMKTPSVDFGETNCKLPIAKDHIQKAIERKRIGVKRKRTRC